MYLQGNQFPIYFEKALKAVNLQVEYDGFDSCIGSVPTTPHLPPTAAANPRTATPHACFCDRQTSSLCTSQGRSDV